MLALFVDIETTGLDFFRHTAIDIGIKAIDVCTGVEKGVYSCKIRPTEEEWERHDPISLQVNGYTFEELQEGKDAHTAGQEIIEFFSFLEVQRGRAVFICQNPGFDRSFFAQLVDVYTQERLNWPYHWLDLASMYWASLKGPFPEKLSISKNSIAGVHHILPEVEPHRALNGVNHLIACYEAVVGWKR